MDKPKIVARRIILFDSISWDWAREQENLSQAIRKLILADICTFKPGRPAKGKLYIQPSEGSDADSTIGDGLE